MSGAAEKTKGAREAARDALAEVLRQVGGTKIIRQKNNVNPVITQSM